MLGDFVKGGSTRRRWILILVCSIVSSGLPSKAADVPKAAKDGKKSAAAGTLFRDGTIPKVYVEIPKAGMDALRKYQWKWGGNDEERVTVDGTVKEGTTIYTNVQIRLKGAAGSFRPVDQNPGLTLNFDKKADGQRFHGLQKISLNNSQQDATLCSDKLMRELYLKAGVPVPRAGHARVFLNGRELGLYVLTEGWNKQFLHRFFKNADGNLYDCTFAKEITGAMHVNSGANPDDESALKALAAAAKEASRKKRLDPLVPVLDIDRFITLLVIDGLVWNWDGYSIGHNNYRVFHDQERDLMVFMPHGLDQMFWRPDGPLMPGGKGLVAKAVLDSPEGRARYMNEVRRLTRSYFTSMALTDRVREISASLEPALKEVGTQALARQRQAAEQYCRMIILRVASVKTQLAGSSNLVTVATGKPVSLTNWTAQSNEPGPETARDDALHLRATSASSVAAARAILWLEAGYYTIEADVKTKGVRPRSGEDVSGAGLRVISQRKPNLGVPWDFFPFRESRDYDKRGEMVAEGARNDRVMGDSDWKTVSYEFDLKQPMADVHVFCELRADKGEAWFRPGSIRLMRRATPKKP